MNSRALAAKIIFQVLEQRQSLMHVLPVYLEHASLKDRGFIQEICYGVLRWLPRLAYQLQPFVTRKPKGRDKIAYHVMLVGLYQLYHMAVPHHAALHATVEAAHQLTPRLKKMVNAVLRHCLRAHDQQPSDFQTLETQYAHALWLIEQIKQSYPQQYVHILSANNTHPPMWIRVNVQQQSREVYQQQLKERGIVATATDFVPSALCLQKPHAVNELPGFLDGFVSVQDASAQLAAYYLDPRPGEKILDACAAPGGKSLHLLQHCPDIQLTAVDVNAQRLTLVAENLQRAQVQATLICGDATRPETWCQDVYDKIILDAPCSATGVIRRHPDIKWLRREQDIDTLVQKQAQCLDAIWPYLRVGGTLLYVTCSILPRENTQQIQAFLARTPSARLVALDGMAQSQCGEQQILPDQQHNMDGFYYARIDKLA